MKTVTESRSPLSIGNVRFYSEDVTHMPDIKDDELQSVFKDLLAENWSDLSDGVVYDANKALSKNTDDNAGKEIVANVFRAAQAVEEFGGILVTLKMEIDDSIGLSGEVFRFYSDIQEIIHTIGFYSYLSITNILEYVVKNFDIWLLWINIDFVFEP